jgi:uncharacterized protein YbjT (DUF2867 family)
MSGSAQGVLVPGASRCTGRLLVERALERGHEVTAVARHPESLLDLDGQADRLRLERGDLRDEALVRRAAAGHDAAISTISGPVRGSTPTYSKGTRAIVRALEAENVRRFICVSSGGVDCKDPGLPWWYRRLAIPLLLRALYRDMQAMEEIVRRSSLDWTIVRSAYLVDKPPRGSFRIQDGRNPDGG